MIMRIFCTNIIFLFALISTSTLSGQKVRRDLNFKINGLSNVTVYLAQYDGAKLFYRDTAKANALGEFQFGILKPLDRGMYAVLTSDKSKWFDFLVNEPKFWLETDLSDFTLHMKTTTSVENKPFYEYLRLLADKTTKKKYITKGRDFSQLSQQEQNEIAKHDGEIDLLRKKIYKQNPKTLVALLMSTYLSPEVPQTIKTLDNGQNNATFFYLKEHYFDLVNLKDDALISIPSFQNMLDVFLDQVVFPRPDSLIVELDKLLAKTNPGSEVYQFIVTHALKKVFASKVTGMDAVFVHLAKTYCDPEKTKWMDKKKLNSLHERVNSMEPMLAGKTAPELKLPDITGKNWVSLHNDIKAEFTILYFWRPDCSSCKKVTPLLRDFYAKIDHNRVKVLAVSTMTENDQWIPYIKENNLDNFIHVSDNEDIFNHPEKYVPSLTDMGSIKFRETFDIYSTPRIFLLDKNKKIIAKRITPDELEEILKILLKK